MVSESYFKVTHGLAFEIVRQFADKRKAVLATIDELCTKYGARKGRFMSCGTEVEGLWFDTQPNKLWRQSKNKGCHSYSVPTKTNKAGKAIASELKAIVLCTDEDVARELGCKPFFDDPLDGGSYCSSVSVNEIGGVFYLQAAKFAPPNLKKFGQGIVEITRGEYFTAIDNKLKTATGS